MADDLKHAGSPDNELINTSQEHEIKYWSAEFGVSREQLLEAVKAAGNSVKAVRQHFSTHTHLTK